MNAHETSTCVCGRYLTRFSMAVASRGGIGSIISEYHLKQKAIGLD